MGTAAIVRRIVRLEEITRDEHTQQRASRSEKTLAEYASDMQAGDRFPPVVLFDDGKKLWLADGWYRVEGAERAGLEALDAEVHDGGLRDAILYSVGANAGHGERRTRGDKRKAILTLLGDQDWSRKSNRWIAEQARVSEVWVRAIKEELDETACLAGAHTAQLTQTVDDSGTSGTSFSGSAQNGSSKPGKNGHMPKTVHGLDGKNHPASKPASPSRSQRAKPEAEKPLIIVDKLGVRIPEKHVAAFALAEKFRAAKQLQRQLHDLLTEVAQTHGGEYLRRDFQLREVGGKQSLRLEKLYDVGRLIDHAAAYSGHCPYCWHDVETPSLPGCTACHGFGFVTEDVFNNAPEDYQAAVKKLSREGD